MNNNIPNWFKEAQTTLSNASSDLTLTNHDCINGLDMSEVVTRDTNKSLGCLCYNKLTGLYFYFTWDMPTDSELVMRSSTVEELIDEIVRTTNLSGQ
jgi:hypothetical protein